MKHPLRELARGQTCTLRIPGVCNHDPETTVLAHLGCVDKGMGYKSPDWWAVHACSACHDLIDGRQAMDEWTERNIDDYKICALYETQKRLIAAGLITIGKK